MFRIQTMIGRKLSEFSRDSQRSNLNFFFLYWRRCSRLKEKEILSGGGKGANAPHDDQDEDEDDVGGAFYSTPKLICLAFIIYEVSFAILP